MSSSATDGGGGRLVSAMASTASEASTSSTSSGNEHSERQVKFAVPTCKSSSSNCNSNGPDGTGGTSAKPAGTSAKGKGGMSKVFQRSCSSAGVLGSLSKQQSLVKNPTEKDEKPASGILSNIPEDKVSLVFTYPLNFVATY